MIKIAKFQHTAHLLSQDELDIIEKASPNRQFWLPIEWSLTLLKKTYNRRQIDEHHYSVVVNVRAKIEQEATVFFNQNLALSLIRSHFQTFSCLSAKFVENY